jgi:hypothetical protein
MKSMLKNHMQPIAAYFANAGLEAESNQVQLNQVQSNPRADAGHRGNHSNVNPMQPIVDYFDQRNDQSDDQRKGDQQNLNRRSPQHQPTGQRVQTKLGRFWHRIMTVNPDPQIREKRDRSGQSYWQVYDPMSQTSRRFFAEEEVYRWLEQRYYA